MFCPECRKNAETYIALIWRGSHYHCTRCGYTVDVGGVEK